MKTSLFILAFLASSFCRLPLAHADTSSAAPVQDPSIPKATDFRVTERGANHRIFQRETYEKMPNGKVATYIHKYTEMATGMHYKDAKGQWAESKELIEAFPGGAIARQGRHQVIFANNLNSYGAIDLQTPDGQRIRSHVLGLMYSDPASGKAVMFARVQDSQGQLVTQNQVLYPNAFTGVKADVQYTYKRGSFEQDVILREQPPAPAAFGMNPDTTELEVVTEFAEAPQGKIIQRVGNTKSVAAMVDQDMDWGAMRIVRGKAFELGQSPMDHGQATRKQFLNLKGRQVLLEKVRLPEVEAGLSKLPRQASNTKIRSSSMALASLQVPEAPPVRTNAQPMKLASMTPSGKGFVLDYVEINSGETDFTFQADTTYYVSGEYNLSGTTTIEGGAVIKLDGSGQIDIDADGTFVCKTAPYRPAVFTSVNDNTVGEAIGSGSPAFGDVWNFLNINMSDATVHDLRFSYCVGAINQSYSDDMIDIWNCQFVDIDCVAWTGNAGLYNVLISRTADSGIDAALWLFGSSFVAENVTADGGWGLVYMDGGGNAALTNCLVTGQSLGGGFGSLSTNSTVCIPSLTSPIYQTVGAGSYYLTNGSPYRNAGTTNIDPTVLADIRTKTTYPPLIFSNTAIAGGTYSPQAQRDTDTPDLGYHYDPLDYCFGRADAPTNLVFTAGTAVGWFDAPYTDGPYGYSYGLGLPDSSAAIYQGTVTAPCAQVRYSTVQEGGNGNWSDVGFLGCVAALGSAPYDHAIAATIDARFTLFAGHANQSGVGGAYTSDIIYRFTRCMVNSGGANSWDVDICFTNCLLLGTVVGAYDFDSTSAAIYMHNCTMREGSMFSGHFGGSTWPIKIQNCAFENVDFSHMADDDESTDTDVTYCDFNAFVTNQDRLPLQGAHDVLVTNFNWQSSWLGDFYLPYDSSLVDAGSTNANLLGLYHFTTQIDQTKEANSIVDIGYHYMATDTNGVPIDSNGDGTYDYIADANGNGADDPGEVPWNFPSTGMKLWLRADAGITLSSSNQISVWADQSGNTNNATQYNGYAQPLLNTNIINGRPAVWFSGTNNSSWTNSYFNLPNNLLNGSTGAEAFVVLKAAAKNPSKRQSLWEFGGYTVQNKTFPDTDGSISDDFGSAEIKKMGVPTAPLDEFNVYQVSSQTNNWAAWLNGMLLYQTNVNTVQFPASAAWGPFGWYVLGGAPNGQNATPDFFAGNIAEVLVFNRGITTSERKAVNDYLNGKYGLVPVVMISSPTNGAVFATGSNIGLTASAYEPGGGTIKQVEFFQGTTSLGIKTNSPYSLVWSNVAAGGTTRSNYSLTARATGVNGLVSTSSVVSIAVDPPPSVTITNPNSNTYFGIAPVDITIAATASGYMGVSQVQFFHGTDSISIDTSPPYNATWSSAPAGTYTLTAVVLAADGLTATNSITNIIIDTDTDGDGLGDFKESLYGTNPNVSDGLWIWISTPNNFIGIP